MYAVEQLDKGVDPGLVWRSVAALLIADHRSRDTRAFGRALEAELIRRGMTPVTITSATPIDSRVRDSLSKLLGVAHPSYTEVIDVSVIGGVRAEAASRLLDLTVESKLKSLKRGSEGVPL